jgi:hypothetical protein
MANINISQSQDDRWLTERIYCVFHTVFTHRELLVINIARDFKYLIPEESEVQVQYMLSPSRILNKV